MIARPSCAPKRMRLPTKPNATGTTSRAIGTSTSSAFENASMRRRPSRRQGRRRRRRVGRGRRVRRRRVRGGRNRGGRVRDTRRRDGEKEGGRHGGRHLAGHERREGPSRFQTGKSCRPIDSPWRHGGDSPPARAAPTIPPLTVPNRQPLNTGRSPVGRFSGDGPQLFELGNDLGQPLDAEAHCHFCRSLVQGQALADLAEKPLYRRVAGRGDDRVLRGRQLLPGGRGAARPRGEVGRLEL